MLHLQFAMLMLSMLLLHENVAWKHLPAQKLSKVRSLNDLKGQGDWPSVACPECECPETVCPDVDCPDLECPVLDDPSSVNQPSKFAGDQELRCPVCPSVCDQQKVSLSTGNAAFTVELSQNRTLGDAGPLTFDRILFDRSDSFTPLLGSFSCPDDDTYAFYWTIQAMEGRVAAMLVKDGQDVKYGPLTSEIPGETGGSSSMAAIMRCTEGSHVWLRAVTWPDNMACNHILKDYSSFSAFKLFKKDEPRASGFTAHISANTTVTNSNLIFDEEVIDLGNDFNPITGEFKVPEAGIYVFTFSAHLVSGSTYKTYLRKNGSNQWQIPRVMNTYSWSLDSGTSTMTRILDCQKDDSITIFSASTYTYLAGVTSFTGYRLLSPIDPHDLVAFHASLSADKDVIDDAIIEFDQASINVGNYYFPAVGLFVCPDNRMYVLIWAITLRSEDESRAGETKLTMADKVKKAGPQTSRVITDAVSSTSSTQAIVQCEYQKSLAIRAVVSVGKPITLHSSYSNFVGFRLPAI